MFNFRDIKSPASWTAHTSAVLTNRGKDGLLNANTSSKSSRSADLSVTKEDWRSWLRIRGGRRCFFCLRKGAIDSNPLNAKHKPQIALVMIFSLKVWFVLFFNLVCPEVDELLLKHRGRRRRVSKLHLKWFVSVRGAVMEATHNKNTSGVRLKGV